MINEEFYTAPASTVQKRMLVYTPPGYIGEPLPVLYLLHGISQTEESWEEQCGASEILDKAITEGSARPMIAVMPNGRAVEGGALPGEKFGLENVRSFMDFESELISVILPEIDKRYPTLPDRNSRAVTGFSMGGYQSVNFGLAHLDKFAYVGGFSPAPSADAKYSLREFMNDNADTDINSMLKLFYLSNGTAEKGGEGIFGEFATVSERCLEYMSRTDIRCVYETYPGGHEPTVWRQSLYSFIQKIF